MKMPINSYVIHQESVSHGHTDFQIISSFKEFQKLSDELHANIQTVKSRLEADSSFDYKGKLLFNAYATKSPGFTERNSITLLIDDDLLQYEAKTLWNSGFGETIKIIILGAFFVFALIGVWVTVKFLAS